MPYKFDNLVLSGHFLNDFTHNLTRYLDNITKFGCHIAKYNDNFKYIEVTALISLQIINFNTFSE